MSKQFMHDPEVSFAAKTTFALLSTYASAETRVAHPRQGQLASALGNHRTTVGVRLHELESLKWLTGKAVSARDVGVDPSNRRLPNDYTLHDRDPIAKQYGLVAYTILADPTLKVGPKALYALLATHADRVGRLAIGLSRRQLADSLGVERLATISGWARTLAMAGYLEIDPQTASDLRVAEDSARQVANNYRLLDAEHLPALELTDWELSTGVDKRTGATLRGHKRGLLIDHIVGTYEEHCAMLPKGSLQSRAATRAVVDSCLNSGSPQALAKALCEVTESKVPLTVHEVNESLHWQSRQNSAPSTLAAENDS